jgi:hypothetical protein
VGVMLVSKSEIPNDASAIEREGFAVAVQRGEPPVGWGAWHLHGDHHVVAYVLAGTVHVDAGPPGTGPSRPRRATSSTSNPRPFIESATARESSRRSASTSAPGPDAWTSTDPIIVEDARRTGLQLRVSYYDRPRNCRFVTAMMRAAIAARA